MDELNQALSEIAAIRGQMARAGEFHGYGPVTLAATGVLAAMAGVAQAQWVAQPLAAPGRYAALWSAAAAVAAGLIGLEAVARTRRMHRGLADEMIRTALEQFMPAAVAGILLTWVLLDAVPQAAGLLPGLWQIIFSLGVFATCRLLPRPVVAVAVWYLVSGLLCLGHAAAPTALAPWVMAAPFVVGQLMAAAILWRASQRHEDFS